MKSKTKFIILGIILVLLVLFNPSKEDFNKKIHEISTGSSTTYEEIKLFGIDKIYESGYSRDNFYIFSIYKTNGETNSLWTADGYKGKNVTYIGIFKFFIKIN